MDRVSCRQCRELAAELALNVLPARERVGVLAHLDACAGCRDTVSALTDTADRLVELLPVAEPPVGVEHRVMTAWHRHRGARGDGCP
jgi:predicted anti-sigma-YlaC factor YlaD